jgi:hypothetical protein
MALTKVSYSMITGAQFNVLDYGAVGDGVANDTAAIEAAITAASAAVGGSIGAVVYFPTGTYLIGSTITLPNRVGLQGANGRGVTIKPHSSFSDEYMFNANNGVIAMFSSWIRDMLIDARGKNMIAVIWTQAWQETCGMERVTILFDGTTQYGVLYTNGYGGASYCKFSDCEIFTKSSASNAAGILVSEVSSVGGFVFEWDGGSITGDVGFNLPSAIRMTNDTLLCKLLHCEWVDSMIDMNGAGSLSADTCTGSFNAVTDMVNIGSGFTGQVSLRAMVPNGASGFVFKNNITNVNIPANEGMLASYDYQPSAFAAVVSAQIPNVTGNGTDYQIVFNSEIYDYLGEYNTSTGTFTAARSGKYLFSVCVKIAVSTAVTTYIIKLATTGRDYILFRGDTDSIRDGSGLLTLNGSVIADLDGGDTAKARIIISGLGSDSVDVEPDETIFEGHWLSR